MKILITGVAGLIGSNLARFIQNETEHSVIGIDDLSCGLRSNVPENITWYDMSLDGSGCSDVVFSTWKPDVVYHFAAYAAECLSPFIRCYNYQNNVVATAEVVNSCIRHGVKRLVFTSSMAVYGHGEPPFSETDPCIPADPYGVAKLACEHDIRIAGEQHGLDWCVLRPHNVYGPGQVCTQKYRNVFGIWMDRYSRGEPLLIFGDGHQRRAFTFIEDLMIPLVKAGLSPKASKQVINVGGEIPISINGAAMTLSRVIGKAIPMHHIESRHEVAQSWCTVTKSEELLEYRDITPLSLGLDRMWQWFQRIGSQPTAPGPVIEMEVGLPSSWMKD